MRTMNFRQTIWLDSAFSAFKLPIRMSDMRESPSASSPDTSMHLRDSLASSSPRLTSDISSANNNTSINLASQDIQHIASNLTAPFNQFIYLIAAARSRLMFDPLTELPILERWFEENPHPTWVQIDNYTNMLNKCPYRENYPLISQHNVKIWFKNRRAKNKRMQTGLGKMDSTTKLENIFS
ncbi:hypothetical protein WR25_11453 [Diploscapter pachys]|uniref:Homeobox domain-containing protein n=1 Tax=Diploscapter pachys TaxID=2018661 RepID=A0A2A2J6T5_9BILA|nr:hypothetical protein WR25_11453 [Diploscapter pachys]